MRRRIAALMIAFAGAVLLSGCNEGTLFGDNRANIAGAASVVEPTAIEPVSVQELITTINNAAAAAGNTQPAQTPSTLEEAVVQYQNRQAIDPPNNGPWANLRNALQDRVLLASQSRCGFYEEYLKRFQANSATFFGSLATILGGAGAIVTGTEGARTLAGLAGISSGVGAEMQKDLFASVTSAVIVPGIEKRRAAILKTIIANRCQAPDRYTILMALTDALAFHSACAMDVGIAEGGNAIKQAANPGTAGLTAFISLGGQINQAQSVRVSIDKNRRGGTPNTTTIASSVDAPDTTVQAMLDSLNGGMSVSACQNTGTPASEAMPKAKPVRNAPVPAAPLPPAAPNPPAPANR